MASNNSLRMPRAVLQPLHLAAVWTTVAMLLTQAMWPGLVLGCGCQHTRSCGSVHEDACCCCAKVETENSSGCPHCGPPAASEEPASGERESICRCGDFVPLAPADQTIPEPSESSLRYVLDLISGIHPGLTTKVVVAPAPAPPPVLSSEELTHHYKQIVLGVWLT